MRTSLLLAVTLSALAFLSACGAHEGGACSGGVYHCSAQDEILECHGGTWMAESCKGPDGCRAVTGGITCDITGNQEGDGCPSAMEGTGFCRNQSMFTCRGAQVVKLQDCSSCQTTSTSIVCTP